MRTRQIRPGFFCNEDLGELPAEARLLFIGLWCIADRAGRLEMRAKKIKAQIFPFGTEKPIEELISMLNGAFIKCYEVDGKKYCQVINFEKHQTLNRNEADSDIPACCEESDACTCMHVQEQTNAVHSYNLRSSDYNQENQENRIIKRIKKEPEPKSDKVQVLEFLFFKADTLAELQAELGRELFDACAEKLNSWIGSNPTADRLRNGKNAAHTFRSWVIDSVRKQQNQTSFKNSRERNESREALAMQRIKQVEESGAKSLFHIGLDEPKKIGGAR